jgi:hypothetical protein
MYKTKYNALNLITTALCRNVYDRVSYLELFTMFDLSCVIFMRVPLRLSLYVEIFIIGSSRLFLRNLVNHLMITFLDSSPL